jgi:hypothetical protein
VPPCPWVVASTACSPPSGRWRQHEGKLCANLSIIILESRNILNYYLPDDASPRRSGGDEGVAVAHPVPVAERSRRTPCRWRSSSSGGPTTRTSSPGLAGRCTTPQRSDAASSAGVAPTADEACATPPRSALFHSGNLGVPGHRLPQVTRRRRSISASTHRCPADLGPGGDLLTSVERRDAGGSFLLTRDPDYWIDLVNGSLTQGSDEPGRPGSLLGGAFG